MSSKHLCATARRLNCPLHATRRSFRTDYNAVICAELEQYSHGRAHGSTSG
jgi:hypothetical protein